MDAENAQITGRDAGATGDAGATAEPEHVQAGSPPGQPRRRPDGGQQRLVRDVGAVAERVPPQSVELEMAVLGAIMLDPKAAYDYAADILTEADFYLDGHGLLYRVMGELHRRGIPPDLVATLDELRSRDLLDKIGGPGVLIACTNKVPSAANVEAHARKVRAKRLQRELLRALALATDEAYAAELTLDDQIARLEGHLTKIAEAGTPLHAVSVGSVAGQVFDAWRQWDAKVRAALAAGKPAPVHTGGLHPGIARVHHMTGGLQAGRLWIVAGRTSMGKTWMALDILRAVAVVQQHACALISLEMASEEIAERMLCNLTYDARPDGLRYPVETAMLRASRPLLSERHADALADAKARLDEAPLKIVDADSSTIAALRGQARRLKREMGIKVLVVDYLQLMEGERGARERHLVVASISRGLKRIARELRLCVVAVSQLNREAAKEGQMPQLHHISESDRIAQDADVVAFVHRKEYYLPAEKRPKRERFEPEQAQLGLVKVRGGSTGVVPVKFIPALGRFEQGKLAAPPKASAARSEREAGAE